MSKIEPIVIDPKTFLYKHCSLPALPSVLTKIQEAMYSIDVSIDKIATLIKNDPALVAQVLKLVNSAYYSLPIEISNVKIAVAYIGINEIYRIVLSVSVINTLSADLKSEFKDIWFHSFLTAFCSKYFAQKFEMLLETNELWTDALLHDIGKLVYLKFFPIHYKKLINYSQKNGCLFNEAEDNYSLPSSSYFGTLLCERWRLPGTIKKACSSHNLHNLKKINEEGLKDPYIKMVILGNLSAELISGKLSQDKKEEISEIIIKTLNINESDFLLIMGDIIELKEEAHSLLSQFE